jgi:hypothetical protein
MKITLDLRSTPSRLVFTNASHDDYLHIIDELLVEYNDKMSDQRNRLRYRYIPGPLNLEGKEYWLRHFCQIHQLEINEVERSYPPMPAN